MSSVREKVDPFPFRIFIIYVIFYAGQAMYNTYLNLFLTDGGFSMSQIGAVQSISTIVLILVQPIWGIVSDKSKSKNQIIAFLAFAVALSCLAFYAFKSALWVAFCVMLFTVFFSPAFTLQDNYTLELLEKSRWDFGNVRLGGTLGYAICAMIVGFFIGNDYGNIFWMMSFFFVAAGIMYLFLPKVEGHRQKHEKAKYSVLLKDTPLICMLIFNVMYFMGTSFYFQYYPIYFRESLGATSQMVGMLSFVSAMSEVPFFWFAYKIEKKLGVKKVMLLAGIATALRWFLLFFISTPSLVLATSLLSGCGYVGFSYCLIKYISDHAPKSMRATAQSFNAILGTIVSRIIFAPIGGYLGEKYGVQIMLLASGFFMLAGVLFFAIVFPIAERKYKQKLASAESIAPIQ